MTICIIDDHLLLGQSIGHVLQRTYSTISIKVFKTAEEFLEGYNAGWKPDIIISDLLLPGIQGLDLLSSLGTNNQAKFILLTSVVDAHTIKSAIQKGADGYLTKDISEEELIDAINVVMKGGQYISKLAKDKLVSNMFAEEQVSLNLSPREKEVLMKICAGSTPKEISYDMKLSLHTVQHYIKNIMHKFKVNRTTDLVVFAIKKGLYNLSGTT